MFNATMFAINAGATFTYNGTLRQGTVVEVQDEWVRVDMGNGEFRTYRYDRMS